GETILLEVVFDLAGEEDALRAGRERGPFDLGDQLFHSVLEIVEGHEVLDVDGLVKLGGARPAELAAKPAAGENAGHDVEHDRQTVAFWTANRKDPAFLTFARVVGRITVSIDSPAERNLLAPFNRDAELGTGDDARRHVKIESPRAAGWGGPGEW